MSRRSTTHAPHPMSTRPSTRAAVALVVAVGTSLLSGCATVADAASPRSTPTASSVSNRGIVPLSGTVPLDPTHAQLAYTPDASWKEASAGAPDTTEWQQATTGCRLSMLSMADFSPSNDTDRSGQIVETWIRDGGPLVGGATTVAVPRRGHEDVEFAARQVQDRTRHLRRRHGTSRPQPVAQAVAARAFTNMGGYLVLELNCPTSDPAKGFDLAGTLRNGTLVGVG